MSGYAVCISFACKDSESERHPLQQPLSLCSKCEMTRNPRKACALRDHLQRSFLLSDAAVVLLILCHSDDLGVMEDWRVGQMKTSSWELW